MQIKNRSEGAGFFVTLVGFGGPLCPVSAWEKYKGMGGLQGEREVFCHKEGKRLLACQ